MKTAARATLVLFAMALPAACTPSTNSDLRVASAVESTRSRDAVAAMCLDVPDELQTACPFERGHVWAVKAVREPVSPKGRDFLVGARLYVPASPGTTAQWLGHRIGCYQARIAANSASPAAACPLVDRTAKVRVDGTDDGFAVTVKSDDLDVARSILRASESLAN